MAGVGIPESSDFVARRRIHDADILRLRHIVYENGFVSAEEAQTLFAIHRGCAVKDPSWSEFFIESISDYIVMQAEPNGYVTAENAKWLLDHVAPNGVALCKADVDLVVTVLDKSRWSPISLSRFALGEVRRAVVNGTGVLRAGAEFGTPHIKDREIELLRCILYAFAGDGHIAVTRDEADVLFAIDDAVADGDPNPAWTDLFVKAIANTLMAASGYSVPSREEALSREVSSETPADQTAVLAFLLNMVRTNLTSVRAAYLEQTPEERALTRLEQQRLEIITNEEITATEASWLAERLERDGRLSFSETALVAYLAKETTKFHPVLREAINRLERGINQAA